MPWPRPANLVAGVLVIALAVGVTVLFLAGPRDDVDVMDPADPPEVQRAAELAESTWPDWADTELHAGAPGSPLASARGDLNQNDWGIPPSFTWELTFRRGHPTSPQDLRETLRRTCAFDPPRLLVDHRITAHLVARGGRGGVPTGLTTDCKDRYLRGLPWLAYLDTHPFPRAVRASWVHVWASGPERSGDELAIGVDTVGRSEAVAERVMAHFCGYAGRTTAAMGARSSGRVLPLPWPQGDSATVSPEDCPPWS